MTSDFAQRSDRIDRAAATLGLQLLPTQVERLAKYLDLLQRWNRTYNLTAIRDEEQMLVQHVFDCLAVVSPLSRVLAPVSCARLLDVGSGGGLPGVIIAVCLPEVTVTCVDTVGKKAAFLRQAAGDLKLSNLSAEHARVESMRGAFDIVASRAFASLELMTRLTRQLLSERGVWMALKARTPLDEIQKLPRDVEMFHVEHLTVPQLNAERCIVWMRPAAPTH